MKSEPNMALPKIKIKRLFFFWQGRKAFQNCHYDATAADAVASLSFLTAKNEIFQDSIFGILSAAKLQAFQLFQVDKIWRYLSF